MHSLEAIPDLGEVARETRIKVLRRTRVRRGEADITLPAGSDAWYLIEAVRSTPAHPLVWKQVYIDARYAKAAVKVGASNTPIYRLVERLYGEKLVTVRQEVAATAIAPPIAAILAVESGSPGLLIERQYVGESGRVFEVTRASIRPAGSATAASCTSTAARRAPTCRRHRRADPPIPIDRHAAPSCAACRVKPRRARPSTAHRLSAPSPN